MPKLAAFLCLLAVFLTFKYGLFRPITSQFPEDTFDTRIWKPSEAQGILERFGPEHRRAYFHLQTTVDLVFPLVYSFMFAVAIWGLAPRARAPMWLAFVPFVGPVFDYLENASVVTMILHFEANKPLGMATYIGSVATILKDLFFAASFVILIVLVWSAAAKPPLSNTR